MGRVNIIFIADNTSESGDSVKQLVEFLQEVVNNGLTESFRFVEREDGSYVLQNLYDDEIVIRTLDPQCQHNYFSFIFWNAVDDENESKTDYEKISKEIGFREADWCERTIIDLGGAHNIGTEVTALIRAVAAHNQDAPWLVYADCEYNNRELSTIAIGEQLKYHISNFMLRHRDVVKPAWESKGKPLDFGDLSCQIHNNYVDTEWTYGNYPAFLLRVANIFLTVPTLPLRVNGAGEVLGNE